LLAEKVLQQISLQRETIEVGEDKFTLQQLLSATEDKAELELLKRKFSELENDYEGEKAAHNETSREKNDEIAKLQKKIVKKVEKAKKALIEQYEEKIKGLNEQIEAMSKQGSGKEIASLREQLVAVKEENERMKNGYTPSSAPGNTPVK
jgi:hypothetical protein